MRGQIAQALASRRAHVLLSDMAPNMSGNKIIDQGRHYNLVVSISNTSATHRQHISNTLATH